MLRMRPVILIVLLAYLVTGIASARPVQQPTCLPPVALPKSTEPNIFPGEKEVWLGDAAAERIQKDYRLIEDPALNAYLAQIGENLVKHLPLNDLHFRFMLVDLDRANAFVLPGGRIYVSRKLVALAQSEDELAGVLAHEFGHLVTHESAIDFTRYFREALGVTEVTDRKDVFEKYNQFLDSVVVKSGKIKPRDRESGQMAADQAGFYALVSAGYDPSALARFWDRLTETKGKTGGFFSDLFGNTRPEEKRLRDMLKQVNSLPAVCRGARTVQQSSDYTAWQNQVVAYGGTGRVESLHNVISQRTLNPALRSDVSHLRFSPDGKLILAQDDSGITVLSREPFVTLFRIPSPDANQAHFSPDSQSVVFSTSNLRVERWSVVNRALIDAHEIVVRRGCLQTELSPDGRHMMCLNSAYDLLMLDVATSQAVAEKKEYFRPTFGQYFRILLALARADEDSDLDIQLVSVGFSRDGRYFAVGHYGLSGGNGYGGEDIGFALDMTKMTPVSLSDSMKHLLAGGFTFLENGLVAGAYRGDIKKSGIASFPDGKLITPLPLWRPGMTSASKGEYLMIRPIKDYALGIMQVSTQKMVKVSPRPAFDAYGDVLVSELRNGELGLYTWANPEPVAKVLLPSSNLGRLWVSTVSADFRWLALSGRSRGGVWDLSTGESVLTLRGFRGGHFDEASHFYADFPEFETAQRNIAKFSLGNGEVAPGAAIEAKNARQIGPFVTVIRSAKGKENKDSDTDNESSFKGDVKENEFIDYDRNVIFEMRSAKDQSLLWSKPYPKEAPRIWVAPVFGTAAFVWSVSSDAAQAVIKTDPRLKSQLDTMKEKEGDYFVQIVEAATGKELGNLLIETGKGSFRLTNIGAAGDSVMITDTRNRVQLYSLSTGAPKGRVFGGFAVISLASKLLCVENEKGKLALYDLDTMEKRDELVFSGPISMVNFTADGKRLFVLTSDQNSYVIDVTTRASAK